MPRRRLGPLALLLALLLPGLGGSWLSLGHPCPSAVAAAPAQVDHGHGASHHEGHAPHDTEPAGHHGNHCECLGACHAGPGLLVPSAPELAAVAEQHHPVVPRSRQAAWFSPHVPLDLLPPPTAPPVVVPRVA